MVAQQHVAVHHHAGPAAHLTEGAEKQLPIGIVTENRLPPVSTAEHVISCPRILDSDTPRHRRTVSDRAYIGKLAYMPGLTPLRLSPRQTRTAILPSATRGSRDDAAVRDADDSCSLAPPDPFRRTSTGGASSGYGEPLNARFGGRTCE